MCCGKPSRRPDAPKMRVTAILGVWRTSARFDRHRWHPLVNVLEQQIRGRDTAEAKNGATLGNDARANQGPRRQPDPVLQRDRLYNQVKTGLSPVVVPGAKIGPL